MLKSFSAFKPVLLAFAILVGLIVEVRQAQAASPETIIVAGGCFWCVEHDFETIPGVLNAVSGFSGGEIANPSYKQVAKGRTKHLEAVQITFDPDVISRDRLLNMFLRSIDPTDASGQFCDRGRAYTTAIFFSGANQERAAKAELAKAQAELGQKLVTRILPVKAFYPAEDYHQDYSRSSKKILTRFGRKTKAEAYKLYRNSCGRDERVRQLWGKAAPFAGG